MNRAAIERLQQKNVSESIVAGLGKDFNLAPMVARTLYEHLRESLDSCYAEQQGVGQVRYLAVSRESPVGRSVAECERQVVQLTLYGSEDLAVMSQGMAALRRRRILRLTEEAYEQGGLLTHEDLACLLCSSLATVKRDVKALRNQGLVVPTRGQVKDIGKGVSHKTQIVSDYLAGYTFSEIERRQRHSVNAIRRYCGDFVRVIRLQEKGFAVSEMHRVLGFSARLIEEYLQLYAELPADNDRLQLLLSNGEAVPETPATIKRGRWLQ